MVAHQQNAHRASDHSEQDMTGGMTHVGATADLIHVGPARWPRTGRSYDGFQFGKESVAKFHPDGTLTAVSEPVRRRSDS